MPASPGLRIGVPVSTPKTPTLVIVIVPPDMSAGEVLPERAVSVSAAIAPASSRSDSAVGVLDVGHDQPALGGRGDAQVDVVLDDDLAGRLVPGRVDLGVVSAARMTALATNSSGETLTSRKSRRAATRSRSSIVAVTSTVTNSVTCGAVNADATIAAAVCLRTPLIGMRVSRRVGRGTGGHLH